MQNIVTAINEVNEALEIKVQDYLKLEESMDANITEAPVYAPIVEDFSIYYPETKPFQRVVGTINFIKQS